MTDSRVQALCDEFDQSRKIVQNQRLHDRKRSGRSGASTPTPALTSPTYQEVKMADMTQARARELFNYDPLTGVLVWRHRPLSEFPDERAWRIWNTRFANHSAGYARRDGYHSVMVDYRRHLAHRIAWLYTYGVLPIGEIDHINGDPSDNRIANLRDVDKQGNARNAHRNVTNTSGVTGVRFCSIRQKWNAYIKRDNRMINLGRFETKSEAVVARKAAEKALGFDPKHGRSP